MDAYIPQKFEEEDYQKISLYQRLDAVKSKEQLLKMQEEIVDTYGKLPKSVEMLFEKKRLDMMMQDEHVENFIETKQYVEVEFTKQWSSKVDGVILFERALTLSVDIRLRYEKEKIYVRIPKSKNYLSILMQFVQQAEKM